MTTFETVRDMMVDQFKLDPARITLDATLESLNIDSLSAVEFMFLLEEKFAVVFTDESDDQRNEGNDKRTVNDMVEALDRLLAQQRAADPAQTARTAAENTT